MLFGAMLFALSTTSKIALGVMASIFIAFSLLSSFVFPARNPDFPGKKRRNAYLGVCVLLFLAMMATVLIWGKEDEEAEAHGGGGEPTQTTPSETTPAEGGGGGNAVAGKTIFVESCGICHVLQDAGTNGTVGPNLDETKPDEALTLDRVENGKGAMPAFKGQLTDEQIADVVAYVHEAVSA